MAIKFQLLTKTFWNSGSWMHAFVYHFDSRQGNEGYRYVVRRIWCGDDWYVRKVMMVYIFRYVFASSCRIGSDWLSAKSAGFMLPAVSSRHDSRITILPDFIILCEANRSQWSIIYGLL